MGGGFMSDFIYENIAHFKILIIIIIIILNFKIIFKLLILFLYKGRLYYGEKNQPF